MLLSIPHVRNEPPNMVTASVTYRKESRAAFEPDQGVTPNGRQALRIKNSQTITPQVSSTATPMKQETSMREASA
jgi:hypothetical protein